MTQSELFPAAATAARLSHERAECRRDRGIERAETHADAECGDWKTVAMQALEHFLRVRTAANGGEPFLAEEFIHWTKLRLYAQPPDGRAWGGVFARARKAGMIEAVGTARAATSNLSPKPLWAPVKRKAVFQPWIVREPMSESEPTFKRAPERMSEPHRLRVPRNRSEKPNGQRNIRTNSTIEP